MADDLSGYNKAQIDAILHKDGPCLVLAGPGSGKTTVITRRLRAMITDHGIPPQGILVVTFTKAAALEMQLRFETLMGSKLPVSFGTFHAVFFRILREHEKDDPPVIIKETQKREIITSVMLRYGVKEKHYSRICEVFLRIKNGNDPEKEEPISDVSNKTLMSMFEDYRRICKDRKLLDFDDMAYEVLRLFKEDKSILNKWKKRFKYILIDEYQDISPIQDEVISILSYPDNNLFVVGDDDQSIYGFRGAGTHLMLTFPDRYPETKKIYLDYNYRSRPGIINAALKVIKENKSRYPKQQKAARSNSINAAKEVSFCAYKNKKDESEGIIDTLRSLKAMGELNNTAVLYRKNSDADFMASVLKARNIPYVRTKKAGDILEHFITEDLSAYLKFLAGDRTRANFYKIMNRPFRGIDRMAVNSEDRVSFKDIIIYHNNDKAVAEALIKLSGERKRAFKMSIYAQIMFIRKTIGYESYLKKEFKGLYLEENLQILDILQEVGKEAVDLKDWQEKIKNFESIIDKKREKTKPGDEDGVNIMTYHASKGLEFDHVILPDLNEGTVPNKKIMEPGEEEEERRMFYVAMTRAKEDLTIMYVEGTRQEPVSVSRFLSPFLN